MSSGVSGSPGCGSSGGTGSILPGGGGTGAGSRGGLVMLLSLDNKGMPADRRAFPHARNSTLLVPLLWLAGLLARRLVGLFGLLVLALLLLALFALALLLTVLRRLLRVAVLGIVHR